MAIKKIIKTFVISLITLLILGNICFYSHSLCKNIFFNASPKISRKQVIISFQNCASYINALFMYIENRILTLPNILTQPIIEYLQPSGDYVPSEIDVQNIKYIFGNTEFVDNFFDHNQMIDVLEFAENSGIKIDDISILINCDTHSDMFINAVSHQCIADWVNTVISKYANITDYYWVVSDNMIKHYGLGRLLNGTRKDDFSQVKPLIQNADVKVDLFHEESVQKYYITKDGEVFYADSSETENLYKQNGYKEIKIHICSEKNLPDFKNIKVITTFDMDYFSNLGNDTTYHYSDNKSPKELNKAFSKMLQTFAEHNIQPTIHGNCYSNDMFLPPKDFKQAKEFANAIVSYTPQKFDKISKYKHSNIVIPRP